MRLFNFPRHQFACGVFFLLLSIAAFTQPRTSFANTTDCQRVASVPTVINSSGVYCLARDLAYRSTTGVAIEIRSNNVVLDLNGFRLFGAPALGNETVGVKVSNKQKVKITNGTIERFRVGVELDRGIANAVDNLTVDQNRQYGILQAGGGKSLEITDNKVSRTGGSTNPITTGVGGGIAVAILVGNSSTSLVFGARIEGNTIFDVRPVVSSTVSVGIGLVSNNALIRENFVSGRALGTGIGFANGSRNNVHKNTVVNETTDGTGISLGLATNTFSENTAINFSSAFTGGTNGGANVSAP